MWVIFLEAGLALLLLLIIVWATWPRRDEASETDTNPKNEEHD
ncbi:MULTISPECIES: hypothetical protein [Thauera]|jgi:hypothetical protein|nr:MULTISPECIES: hypothetical protein [Thauera]CAH1746966.1 conserved protein of unknown function [Thauera humireducens]